MTRPTTEHLANPRAGRAAPLPGVLTNELRREAQAAIRAWPGYAPTPLLDLPGLARRLGVAAVSWKDEGGRFGLGSFKALGGAYAVQRLVQQLGGGAGVTFAAATDGNHGRSVAWGAAQAGARAVIYLHVGVSAGREAALRALGAETVRVAVAEGRIRMNPETLTIIREGNAKKGDVIATARIAGIMAAKQTASLIPLCHPLMLSKVTVDIEEERDLPGLKVTATVKLTGQTGVEMEALTAVSVTCLTIYDMAKAVDKTMEIGGIRLLEKTGGKSGAFRHPEAR